MDDNTATVIIIGIIAVAYVALCLIRAKWGKSDSDPLD